MSQEQSLLPREGSVMYNFMKETKENKKKTANRYRLVNKYFVVPLYRLNILPLFFIGKIFVLLYIKGRKSGKLRCTPVEYRRYNDKVLVFSARGEHGDWYKNIMANPDDLTIKIGFKKYKPIVSKSTLEQKLDIVKWYIESYPKAAKTLFGYQKKIDSISDDFIKPVAEFLEILQLEI